jgi:G:T-mismatch repair DNA endonuclease (very short patch repair protein)
VLSWNNFFYGFLFPVTSVAIFTFLFSHAELWYRKHSNKKEIEQIKVDILLKKVKSNSRKADSDNKIEELEKKNEILELEIENETKEKDKVIERLNSQLEILELENNKINASVGD